VTIREGTRADIPLIQDMAQATWPVCYAGIIRPAQITYMLDLMYGTPALEAQFGSKGHHFLVAEQEEIPIGFAGFEHGYLGGQRTRLHKLYVLPHVKGRGVGHALLEAALSEARKQGAGAMELNVNKRNPARHFYERHGFVVERDEVLDIGSGYVMDDHVMVLAW
jgi:GNAT superfamily N-acetyltransferase